MRGGVYWSGDLAYQDADGWIYLAGRTADWMRVDGENLTSGPIERILLRLPAINRVAVYPVPDELVGDQVMAAVVLRDGAELTPAEFAEFLAAQPDLSPRLAALPVDRGGSAEYGDQQDPQTRAGRDGYRSAGPDHLEA